MVVRAFFGTLTALLLCQGVAFGQPEPGGDLTTIAYPVAELVVPVSAGRGSEKIETNEVELMARILKQVAPGSWDSAGGLANMRYETKGYLLHVRQSPAVHAELKSFLEKLQRGQVSLELRIVSLSEKSLENLRLQWHESDGIEHALFDDMKLYSFLTAAQGEQTTHIMQMPKVTLLDGQDATGGVFDWMTFRTGADVQLKDGAPVVVPSKEKLFVGVKTRYSPVISTDRKQVTVQAEIVMRNLVSESVGLEPLSLPIPGPLADAGKPTTKKAVQVMIQKPTFSEIKLAVAAKVPDQRTIAFMAGKVLADVKTENPQPPFLARIPYLSRLFRNQAFGREATTVIILLTPRILAEPETAHVERLRSTIQAEDDGQFPMILSQGKR